MRRGSALAFLSIAVALWVPPEAEAGPPSDVIQQAVIQPLTGNFQALDFWKTLKLGGAYWVNPSAVRDVRIAYAFDPKDFTAANTSTDIFTLGKTGQVSFGLPTTKDSFKAVTLSDLTSKYKVDDQISLTKLLTSGNISVIAGQDFLLGAKPTVTLVGVNAK
jgi:hypothetical protein